MKLLLTRRANWMQKDLEEMTPLHLTTRHRSPKCLALLLKFMAPGEVDTQDKNKVIDSQGLKTNEKRKELLRLMMWSIRKEGVHCHHLCGRATPHVQTSQYLLKVCHYLASHHRVDCISFEGWGISTSRGVSLPKIQVTELEFKPRPV